MVVPLPSWPSLLRPQHLAVSMVVAQVWEVPAVMAVTPVSPATAVGTVRWVVVPSPSGPETFQPQNVAVRVEVESVFQSAKVAVHGRAVGEHIGKGYTAFTLDVTDALKYGEENELTVEADNSFFDGMLPRNNSYDWTPDGGIYRPVWLHATPALYIERVEVDAAPEATGGRGVVGLRAVVRNRGTRTARLVVEVEVYDDATGLAVARSSTATEVGAGKTETVTLPAARIEQAKLWHFDHPNLYRVRVTSGGHSGEATCGIRPA